MGSKIEPSGHPLPDANKEVDGATIPLIESNKLLGCMFICRFPNSSERDEPFELKF